MTNVIDEVPGPGDAPTAGDGDAGESARGELALSMLGTFDDLLSTVEASERIIRASMALRAARIDQLRLWSEAMAAAGAPGASDDPDGGDETHGWTAAVRGRRELVFELACTLRIPEGTADRLIAESCRLLHVLPATYAALRDGEISYRHAQVIVDQSSTLPVEACADFELELLPFAKTLTVAKFTAVARKKRESLHPESITERHSAAVEERRVWVDPLPDGMAFLGAHLSAEIALAAFGRLTEIAQGQSAPDERRTLAQRRADALGDLLVDGDLCAAAGAAATGAAGDGDDADAAGDGDAADAFGEAAPDGAGGEAARVAAGEAAPVGHGIRAKVLVTVPVLTLLDSTGGRGERPAPTPGADPASAPAPRGPTPANLEGYGPIDPDTARRLTAGAPNFTRVLTDPVSSAILDFDRNKYVVPASLRLVLRVRDETCRAPGCNRSAVHCDVDHSVDWALGGTTRIGNLAHLCQFHHNLKHHTRVSLRNLGDGRIEWRTPTGRRYITDPANTIGAEPPPTG